MQFCLIVTRHAAAASSEFIYGGGGGGDGFDCGGGGGDDIARRHHQGEWTRPHARRSTTASATVPHAAGGCGVPRDIHWARARADVTAHSTGHWRPRWRPGPAARVRATIKHSVRACLSRQNYLGYASCSLRAIYRTHAHWTKNKFFFF